MPTYILTEDGRNLATELDDLLIIELGDGIDVDNTSVRSLSPVRTVASLSTDRTVASLSGSRTVMHIA